jgi:hypothetical protein
MLRMRADPGVDELVPYQISPWSLANRYNLNPLNRFSLPPHTPVPRAMSAQTRHSLTLLPHSRPMDISLMVASRQMNLAMGLETIPPTPYLVVLSPQAPSPVVTSILGEVLAVGDLVPAAEGVQVPTVLVRAPVVDVIGCWSQTWVMRSQKSPRSIPGQRPRPNRLHSLNFRLSNNNGGPVLKTRRRRCTNMLCAVLNRYKVSSLYLPLSRARRPTRYVEVMVCGRTADSWFSPEDM